MKDFFLILFTAIFTQNYVFVKFYGLCPFLGTANSVFTALKTGLGVMGLTTVSGCLSYGVYHLVLSPLGISYLTLPTFILIIAVLVQTSHVLLLKFAPRFHSDLGIYLPLLATNSVILAACLAMADFERSFSGFFRAFSTCLGAGMGFLVAVLIFAGVKKRVRQSAAPAPFRGIPLSLISAGLCAMVFFAFSQLYF